MKHFLTRMVRTIQFSRQLAATFHAQGYHDNPYERIFGELADMVYALLGEETDTFDESVTCQALCSDGIPNDQRVALLLSAYQNRTST